MTDDGERLASDLRDTSVDMPDGVRFIESDGLALADAVPNDYLALPPIWTLFGKRTLNVGRRQF